MLVTVKRPGKDIQRPEISVMPVPHTSFNLRRYLHPKALSVGIVEVDNFGQEEHNCSTPEYCTKRLSARFVENKYNAHQRGSHKFR